VNFRPTGLSNFLLFQRAIASRNIESFKTAEKLSTQKRINRPSDDPEGSKIILSFKDGLQRLEQYEKNLNVGDRMLKQTESSLMTVKDILLRAKDLAIQGRNGTLSQEGRTALAQEIQQLQQELLRLSNTELNGEYLFSGYRSGTIPFTLSALQPNANPVATYNGDTNVRSIQIGDASNLVVQSRGDLTFMGDGTAATVNLFQTMANLEVALRAGNLDDTDPASVGSMIDNLQIGIGQVINEITTVGAYQNRIESARSYLGAQIETIKTFVSSLEDVDMAEAAFEYQRANIALDATLTAAGNILNLPSLMDFIGR
jgi:flagellar hook-associated protein 3 FlgL